MSSILLSNPFLPPSVPGGPPPDQRGGIALTPVLATRPGGSAEDAAGHSGSGKGSGESRQGDTAALLQIARQSALARPQEATGGSVISAQSAEIHAPLSVGANLPKVQMPDPVPTSPFLKSQDNASQS